MNLKERARKLKTDVPALFLALKDKETPIVAKVLAGITVAYALSSIDLVPDERCKKQSEGMWKEGKTKKWYYAMPIVLI